jgi:hypothetical protein
MVLPPNGVFETVAEVVEVHHLLVDLASVS